MGTPVEDFRTISKEIKYLYRVAKYHNRVCGNRKENPGPMGPRYEQLEVRTAAAMAVLQFFWTNTWQPLGVKYGPFPDPRPDDLSTLNEATVKVISAITADIDPVKDVEPTISQTFDRSGTPREKYFEVHDAVADWHLKCAANFEEWLNVWQARLPNNRAQDVVGALYYLTWPPFFGLTECNDIPKRISKDDGLGVDDQRIDGLYPRQGKRFVRGLVIVPLGQDPSVDPIIDDFDLDTVRDESGFAG